MRKAGALVLLTLLWLTACGEVREVKVLKLGHGLDVSHPVHRAMLHLGERLAELSGGTVRVDVHPGNQLGTQRESLELLQLGSLAMTKVSSSALEGFVPEYRVLGLPYLFRDDAHRFGVLEGEIGRELLRRGERYRLRGLCYYDSGWRSFYTKKAKPPILHPDDLRGLKIRVQESPVALQLVRSLGGSATPIAWGELYTALQQGIVDGAENNPPSFYLSGHYEVCKHYALNRHSAVPDVLLIGTPTWHRLNEQERVWLQQAADESAQLQKRLWREATQHALREVRRAGVRIYEPDPAPFRKRTSAMHEEFARDPELGPWFRRIQQSH